jgi:hypothetical protein
MFSACTTSVCDVSAERRDSDLANRPIVKSRRYRLGASARSMTMASLPVPQHPPFRPATSIQETLPELQARLIGGQPGFHNEWALRADDSPGIWAPEGREQSCHLNRPVFRAKSHDCKKAIWTNYF